MFWDSSAIVPLLLAERRTSSLESLLGSDPEMVIWWGCPVECQSALYRRYREKTLSLELLTQGLGRLGMICEDAQTVAATTPVRLRAGRLLATHALRAGDALQLAAALVWCEEQPAGHTVVCVDERLLQAAQQEGFSVLPEF